MEQKAIKKGTVNDEAKRSKIHPIHIFKERDVVDFFYTFYFDVGDVRE